MSALVRWGILGTGLINRRFLAHAREAANAEFVAVGSRTAERAAAFSREYGIERAHGSYDDLLADPAVDAVYICLPNALHHAWTMRARGGGRDVGGGEPGGRRPGEVGEAFEAAAAAR